MDFGPVFILMLYTMNFGPIFILILYNMDFDLLLILNILHTVDFGVISNLKDGAY